MAGNHPNLKLAIKHAALDRIDGRHRQLQADLGRQVRKQCNRLTQASCRVAGGLVKHRQVQLAAHAPVDLIDTAAKGIGAGQQAQGFGVNLFAFGGQGKAGPATPAQRQPKPSFQVLEVAADR